MQDEPGRMYEPRQDATSPILFMAREPECLLIGGYWPELMLTVLDFLNRAGFIVDVLSIHAGFKKHRLVRQHVLARDDASFLAAATDMIRHPYALVVPCDDPTLGRIMRSGLTDAQKSVLLPVMSSDDFIHIYSKIGLSQILRKHGIPTPDFRAARDRHELEAAIRELGYPVFVKIDASSGGLGIFEATHDAEARALAGGIAPYPVLVQKRVPGVTVSMEAFYRQGRLVHFAYSMQQGRTSEFGPTSIRRYVPRAGLEQGVFEQLDALGGALGADGFVNIGSIRSDIDGDLYFFEADMRPNLWINHPRHFGDDPAGAIRQCFSTGTHFDPPCPPVSGDTLLPHALRLGATDLMLNRHQVWRYLPSDFVYITLRYRIGAGVVAAMARLYKRLLPRPYRKAVKRCLASLGFNR